MEKKKTHSYELPLVGLRNELFFCYMHSGLQSLLSISDLNTYMLRILKSQLKEISNKKIFKILQTTQAYLELVETIKASEGKEHVKVGTLRSLVSRKFNARQQHDCQEFVLYFLSQIEEELDAFFRELSRIKASHSLKFQNINIVDFLFKGKIRSLVTCANCSNQSATHEPFLTLSLALAKSKSLDHCLEDFFKEERIADYDCDKCKLKHKATKRTHLDLLPKNLIFHLKRFKFFPKTYKLSHSLAYPLDNLTLAKYPFPPHTLGSKPPPAPRSTSSSRPSSSTRATSRAATTTPTPSATTR